MVVALIAWFVLLPILALVCLGRLNGFACVLCSYEARVARQSNLSRLVWDDDMAATILHFVIR